MQKDVTKPPKAEDEGSGEENRSLWDELGLPEPAYLDESRAPAVDRSLILKMVRRELSEERAKAVGRLIVLFESWNDAHVEIVREELKRRREEK